MSTNHPWRLRVYRWTSEEGPERDRPLECIIDTPLDESEAIDGMDLTDTHGSIERSYLPPATCLRDIIERSNQEPGKPGETVIGHTFVQAEGAPYCKHCGWPERNHR